jgi:hypothetical protein
MYACGDTAWAEHPVHVSGGTNKAEMLMLLLLLAECVLFLCVKKLG